MTGMMNLSSRRGRAAIALAAALTLAGSVAEARVGRGGGFGTWLFAGLLGAGLLGMLFGNGFFGGLAGLASFFGLLIQVGLLALLAVWVVRWFRRREQPAAAQAYGRASTGPGPMPLMGGAGRPAGGALGAMLGSRPAATRAARPGVRDEVAIGEAD